VYALKTGKLGLGASATPAVVGYYLGQHTLAKASSVSYYERRKATRITGPPPGSPPLA